MGSNKDLSGFAARQSQPDVSLKRNSVTTLPGVDLNHGLEDPVLAPAHPRKLNVASQPFPSRILRLIRQIGCYKPSFLDLYGELDSTGDKVTAAIGAFLAIAAGIPLPVIFVIFSKIINNFPPTPDEVQTRITQLLSLAVAYFAVTTAYTCIFGRVGERIAINMRERLLESLLKLDQAYFDTHDLDVTGLLTSRIETVQVGTSEKAGIFLQSISYFVAAFTVGFVLNAKLTGILLGAVIPAIIIIVATGSIWISRLSRIASVSTQSANGIAEAALRAVKIIQAFDIAEDMCQQYAAYLKLAASSAVRKEIVSACMLACVYFVAYAANGLAFYVGSVLRDATSSSGEAGTIYAVCLLILDASFIVGQFAPFLEIFAKAASAGRDIRQLVDESKHSSSAQMASEIIDLRDQAITISEVSFAYPARSSQKSLQRLNVEFEPGQLNAVVGTSGGGKSTLLSLLLGIYTDYTGSIRIGGHDLRDLDIEKLRAQMSVVDQECVLFSGSILDNICYGLAGTSVPKSEYSARCIEAVDSANVDFLYKLPAGLDTIIDNSLQLSGGQKQRLCLARAVIKRPAVLILDEPTSALDAQSEAVIAKTVKKIADSGTLVIMIAHRLSTVLDADKIVVFSEGRVVESGTPVELSTAGTVFNALLQSQYSASPPIEDPMLAEITDEKEISPVSTRRDGRTSERPTTDEQSTSKTQGTFKQVRELLSPEKFVLLLGVAFSTVTGGIIVGEALAFGNLVELINDTGSPSKSRIDYFCLIFFILACVALVTYSTSGSAFGVASARFTERVQVRLLGNLLRQDIQWFSSPGHSVHGLMARISTDTGNLASLSGAALGTLFTITTSMISGIVLSLAIAWKIAIVLFSCVPILGAAGYLRVRILAKSEERQRTAYNEAATIAAESCRNIRTVTMLGLQHNVLTRYRKALQRPYRHRLHFTIAANALLALSFAITYFVYALAYWWGSKLVRDGEYTSRQFFIVLPALLFSAQSAGQAFSLSPEITKAKSAARSVAALLDATPTILINSEAKSLSGLSTPASDANSKSPERSSSHAKIEFDNVSMRYNAKNDTMALNAASFSIHAGETVALVGPSGAGKSTSIALLERFFEPCGGSIKVDGIEISSHDPRQLRARIGLVPQEPNFFPGSIRHNLTLGVSKRRRKPAVDIEEVCRKCAMHDFITSLPEGYDTECSSAGSTKLSGGQQQRLCIARAMIRDPEILLLDEPTSALDAHSEREVQTALSMASTGRTTLIVAHRLASIQHVDRIMVFDHGRVAETGTHNELIRRGGLYASMAKAQSLA